METLTGRQIRVRLILKGLKVKDLAQAAGLNPSDLSGILRGKEGYFGAARRARLEEAIRALGLDTPDDDEPASA